VGRQPANSRFEHEAEYARQAVVDALNGHDERKKVNRVTTGGRTSDRGPVPAIITKEVIDKETPPTQGRVEGGAEGTGLLLAPSLFASFQLRYQS